MHALRRRQEQLKGHACCAKLCAHFTLLLITAVWFFYLIFGAVIFIAIEEEGSEENRKIMKQEFSILMTDFFKDTVCNSSVENNTISEEALSELETKLYRAMGLSPNKYIHWDFLGGVHYCLSVISTIGYGHYVPATQIGRGLTMLYALFGIPLNLIFLARVGTHLSRLITFTYYHLSCFIDRRQEEEHRSDVTSISSATASSAQTSLSDHSNDTSPNKDNYSSQSHSCKTSVSVIELDYREHNGKQNGHVNHVDQEKQKQNSDIVSENKKRNSEYVSYTGNKKRNSECLSCTGNKKRNSDSISYNKKRNSDLEKPDRNYSSVPENFKVPVLYVIFLYFMYNTAGASLIWYREYDWTFLDSFYYAFISLSTIGFGDLLPDSFTSNDQLERIIGDMVLILYISLGMALLSASFTILIDRANGFDKKNEEKQESEDTKSETEIC
ncbi:uncharacterized protein [Antedon mediterranea]|uniref:uncharacterized protein n=1 Tax=Antedon mediterranea TaxID=105859 RepID=UPI003AF75B6D